MDLLERVGLAGLYMALEAARAAGHDLAPLEWNDDDLTPNSVTVRWTGPAKSAFVKLIQWAWQVRDGVFYFPAVHTDQDTWWRREAMHNGLMKTYFQNPNVQPALEATLRVVEIEEGKTVQVRYKVPGERIDDAERGINPKTRRLHKRTIASQRVYPHRITEDEFFDVNGAWKTKLIELSNWIYPGCAGRYGSEQSWLGAADRALLLMLAPTVCMFQRLQGEGGNWVLIVPDVRDLCEFAQARRRMVLNPDFVDVASLGDAGLRFLADYTTGDVRKKLHAGCRVIAMGNVTYYQNQSIRKAVLDVTNRRNAVGRYRILQRVFPNLFFARPVRSQAATVQATGGKKPRAKKLTESPVTDVGSLASGWFKIPTGRGRIADNLVNDRPWYVNLSSPLNWDRQFLRDIREANQERNARGEDRPTDEYRIWLDALSRQRSQLVTLVNDRNMTGNPDDQVFLEAIWDTLARHYVLEHRAAAERGGSRTPEQRMSDLDEQLQREFYRANTKLLLRKTLAAFFSRPAGMARSSTLCNNVATIWRLIDCDWEKGRDLALLGLMTYQSRQLREGKAAVTDLPTNGDQT